MFTPKSHHPTTGFTLVELLTVIAIIAVLMGILFPTIGSAIENAKKVQAKNDELQIVNAVKGYYTEYGKYPATNAGDFTYDGQGGNTNDKLMTILMAKEAASATPLYNPRKIVFLEVPDAKKEGKAGIQLTGPNKGQFCDPWGNAYNVGIDTDYDNTFTNPYTSNAGNSILNTGVIAWSIGRDGGTNSDKNKDKGKDDVISWQ